MKFLSTVFFVVLTIGIRNVHAQWNDESKALHDCFTTFFVRMHNLSVDLKYLNASKIDENKSLPQKGFCVGYPENFESLQDFNTKTETALTNVLKPFMPHSYSKADGSRTVKSVKNIVESLASCINNNSVLASYHKFSNIVNIKDQLYRFYVSKLLTKRKVSRRPAEFERSCRSIVDPFAGAGTSSAPQSSGPPEQQWEIYEDNICLKVGPRETAQINEDNWYLSVNED